MRQVFRDVDKKNAGSIGLVPDSAEDMWHAYNLINVGDSLRSTTIRRVINESSVGLTSTSRVHTTLTILVESMDFDIPASVLRVKGKNVEENAYVKMGAYHTIDLELNRKFSIRKDEWDSVALDRIQEACDPAQNADLAAVVMQEGLAHVCLVLSTMTLVKSKIDMPVPRKRKGLCSQHDKGLEKFFERIIQALCTHVNFDVVKACIFASPGFIKDQFYEYMLAYAAKNTQTHKVLLDNRSKFILVHSSSGFKHALRDIFEDPALAARLSDTKALGEVKSLDSFYQVLKNEPNKAFYGIKHVERASDADAIDCLLISDSLFRSKEINERKRYVKIVDRVRENNGTVKMFSSLHVSGEQLLQLTGVAAILRFPMPDIEDTIDSDSDEDDNIDNEDKARESFQTSGHLTLNTKEEAKVAAATKPAPAASTTETSPAFSTASSASSSNNSTKTATPAMQTNNKQATAKTATNVSKKSKQNFKNKENNYDDYDYDDHYSINTNLPNSNSGHGDNYDHYDDY